MPRNTGVRCEVGQELPENHPEDDQKPGRPLVLVYVKHHVYIGSVLTCDPCLRLILEHFQVTMSNWDATDMSANISIADTIIPLSTVGNPGDDLWGSRRTQAKRSDIDSYIAAKFVDTAMKCMDCNCSSSMRISKDIWAVMAFLEVSQPQRFVE